jgi:hypothetical protein
MTNGEPLQSTFNFCTFYNIATRDNASHFATKRDKDLWHVQLLR